jgi:hypothetical protein
VKCSMCERPRFNESTPYCWLHARAVAGLEERSVMELIGDCCYKDVETWVFCEFLDRIRSVRPKLAGKVELLIENLQVLTVPEAEQFADFSPAEREFLRSRLDEIVSASIEMMA